MKQEIKEVIYKHLMEQGVLSEVSEAGVADPLPVSVGEGAEYLKPEEITGVLTFYPTCQIFLPRFTAPAHINIAYFFSI